MVRRIQSLSNPQLRRLKQLHKAQRGQTEFLIEGTNLVSEALIVGWPVCAVYYTEQWASSNDDLIQRIPDSIEQYAVDSHWLKQAVTTQHPCGVVAIGMLRKEMNAQRGTGLLSTNPGDWGLALAAEGVQDPGNAGTLLRSVVALGGNRFYLSPDSVSPVHPKFLRSTAGQWFRSPPVVSDITELALHAKSLGAQVVVADTQGQAVIDVDLCKPTVFILGTEGRGISQTTKALADVVCTIPMTPGVESLNVAIAGTILLYESQRQRTQTKL